MRRRIRLAVVAITASVLVVFPSGALAARLHLGNSVYRLSLEATNGYRLRLSTYFNTHYHRVSLTAENEADQFVRYSVEGTAHDGRLDAVFPGLGEVEVKMHRSRVRELPPPKGCDLPTVIESGVFEGTIRFQGEDGYTSVDTDGAPGSIERSPRQECTPPTMSAARPLALSGKTGAFPANPPSHFSVLQMTAGSLKISAEGVYGTTTATFSVIDHERRGDMGISRGFPAVSGAGDLEIDATMTGAVVAPPAPFLGTATYSGPEQATGCEFPCPPPEGILTGSLSLPLPGLGIVPLTGPAVTATVYEQTREYAASVPAPEGHLLKGALSQLRFNKRLF